MDFFGPTDLAALYARMPQMRPLFERLLGPLADHEAEYRAASPVSYADRIRVPMWILHGAADRVIPLDQSIKLVEALRAAGRPPQFRQFTGGHGFEGAEEADAFETTAAFLADHLRAR